MAEMTLEQVRSNMRDAMNSVLKDDTRRMVVDWYNAIDAAIKQREQDAKDAEVYSEIDRATAKFPTWPTDPLHAVSVLGEEYGELVKATLQHTYEPHKSTLSDVREEAVQTAAMALRFVRSIDRYEFARCKQHSQTSAMAKESGQ